MRTNGHAWIVTHEKASRCDCSGRQSAAAGILLPRATAPFFSVKLFELAA